MHPKRDAFFWRNVQWSRPAVNYAVDRIVVGKSVGRAFAFLAGTFEAAA